MTRDAEQALAHRADKPQFVGERGLRVAGGITGYRRRTFELLRTLIVETGGVHRGVDVGAGDGWMACSLMGEGLIGDCVPIDVVRRREVIREPVLYNGVRVPLDDKSVDLAYAVDTIHHADQPLVLLGEMARVSRRWIVLKDHTYATSRGAWMLKFLDEAGNRRFSIASPGHYQRRFEWFDALRTHGFVARTVVHPAPCHRGVLGAITNRLQFAALFERVDGK